MSTKTGALKKSTKGEPPKRGQSKPVISNDTREQQKKKPLQVMVSEDSFDDFSKLAGEMFGHKKGAKSLFFEWLLQQHMKT